MPAVPPPAAPPPPVELVVVPALVAGVAVPELPELGVLAAAELPLPALEDALVPELAELVLLGLELAGVLVVFVLVPVELVVCVLAVFELRLAVAPPGTVSGGASVVSAVTVPPPPQPASASATAPAATRARSRRAVGPLGMVIVRSRAAPCAARSTGSR